MSRGMLALASVTVLSGYTHAQDVSPVAHEGVVEAPVVYFEAAGPARASVRGVSLRFGADEESQRMRAFFAKGNATTLSQLQRHFAGRAH